MKPDTTAATDVVTPRACSPELLNELRALENHARECERQAEGAVAQAEVLRRHARLRAQQTGELQEGEVLDIATGLITLPPTK